MVSLFRLFAIFAAVVLSGSAFAAQSLVGKWAPSAGMCNAPPAITIGPKSLVGEDFTCRFDTVSRKGGTVTWKGRCSSGDTDRPRTIIAKRSGKKMYYRTVGEGGWTGPYVRCAI